MSNDIKRLLIPPEIKAMLYTSLGQVLRPLIEKWDEEIENGPPDSDWALGLKHAREDVQQIIDKAEKRMIT